LLEYEKISDVLLSFNEYIVLQKQPAVEVKIEFYTGIIVHVLTFLSVENGYLRSTVTELSMQFFSWFNLFNFFKSKTVFTYRSIAIGLG
jgi:hypothetical protein